MQNDYDPVSGISMQISRMSLIIQALELHDRSMKPFNEDEGSGSIPLEEVTIKGEQRQILIDELVTLLIDGNTSGQNKSKF